MLRIRLKALFIDEKRLRKSSYCSRAMSLHKFRDRRAGMRRGLKLVDISWPLTLVQFSNKMLMRGVCLY